MGPCQTCWLIFKRTPELFQSSEPVKCGDCFKSIRVDVDSGLWLRQVIVVLLQQCRSKIIDITNPGVNIGRIVSLFICSASVFYKMVMFVASVL